jgi:hypothetical protein
MTEHSYPVVEFEATIDDDGVIRIPAAIAATLPREKRVTIRLTKGSISRSLIARGIGEDDVERMALMQREEREDILRFLHAEGVLSGNRMFARRTGNLLGRKT